MDAVLRAGFYVPASIEEEGPAFKCNIMEEDEIGLIDTPFRDYNDQKDIKKYNSYMIGTEKRSV